jgi:hypothetical protein
LDDEEKYMDDNKDETIYLSFFEQNDVLNNNDIIRWTTNNKNIGE